MTYVIDPEGAETSAISVLASLKGSDVLEVGCGNGRVTWRYADEVASVLAVDLNPDRISEASAATPERLRSKVAFRVGDFNEMVLPGDSFDAVIFSNSL